jgi:hypothetical protein
MEQARGTSQLPTFSIIYGLENTVIHSMGLKGAGCFDRFPLGKAIKARAS